MQASFLLSLFAFVAVLEHLRAKDIPPSEFQALYALYNATNGPAWHWANQSIDGMAWDFTDGSNPCLDHWQGLICDWNVDEPYYHIKQLDLLDMNLKGFIPYSIDQLTDVYSINLMYNALTGTLPSSIGNMSMLYYFGLNSNFLSGSIPESFSNLTSMQYILFGYNHFTGPFPDMSQQLSMSSIGLGANHFSGPIPEYLGDLLLLNQLNLYFNDFTGTLPMSMSSLPVLYYLGLQYNDLSGPVHLEEHSFATLLYCGLYDNSFSGPLPDAIGNLPKLQYFEAHNNRFSGPIPPSLGNLKTLLWLDMHENHLSGKIPETFGQMSSIRFISLSSNQLIGSIPNSLSNLSTLAELLLENNALTGNLHSVFNTSVQRLLTTVELNNNQLTGTLPADVFAIPTLTTFAVVSNCFEGSLPATICTSAQLRSLVLDGLSSASACQRRILPAGVSKSYLVQRKVTGQIPQCLFYLPNLTTLHLSGNGFTGTLPVGSNLPLSASLIDLSLSHNRLAGTIPAHIQEKQWFNLDLSYNRLSGTLSAQWFQNTTFSKPAIYTKYITEYVQFRVDYLKTMNITLPRENATTLTLDVSVSLENNRLSGRIPGILQRLQSVAILGSNLFSCSLDEHNLPPHDTGIGHYQCGSNSFDVPYYLWMVLAGCTALLVVVAFCGGKAVGNCMALSDRVAYAKQWYFAAIAIAEIGDAPAHTQVNTAKVFDLLHFMVKFAAMCTTFVFVVLLPLYLTMSVYYGTMTHQYAWTVSAAYLSGRIPMALEFTCWLLVVLGFLCTFVRFVAQRSTGGARHTRINSVQVASTRPARVHKHARTAAIYAVYLTINVIVVVSVNVAYVYIAIYENTAFLTLAQILISFFKLLWNNLCAATILKRTAVYFAEENMNSSSAEVSAGDDSDPTAVVQVQQQMLQGSRSVETRFSSLQIFVALFNNIVIPCATVAIVSPNCFYNVFVAAPDVSSSYAYYGCAVIDRLSGSCGVYVPLISHTSYAPPFTYNYQCSSSLITYYGPAFVNLCIVTAFLAPALQYSVFLLYHRATPGTRWFRLVDGLLTRIMKPVTSATPTAYIEEDGNGGVAGAGTYDPVRPYFNASRVMIILFNLLGLLLTFGVTFPPLALALLLSIVVVATLARLRVGRFLTGAAELKLWHPVRTVETECTGVGSVTVLKNAMWMLITISCWFYTLFLFDTLGDAVGFDGAYWVLIVMPLMPVLLYVLYLACKACVLKSCSTNHASAEPSGSNMRTAGACSSTYKEEEEVVEEVSSALHGGASRDSCGEVTLELRGSSTV